MNVEVVRLRFTPAAGLFYGPPQATAANVDNGPAVRPSEAFLDAQAGWFGSDGAGERFVIPRDTFDFRTRGEPSLGVVDDTCEARIEVALDRGAAASLSAHANVFVAPPDFAPDRRPFLSIADELNDRDGDSEARNLALTGSDLDDWVADLFERVYETVSLLNVDLWRGTGDGNALPLPADKLAPALPGDGLAGPKLAMGGEDALRNCARQIDEAKPQTPLPLSTYARERHRGLSDAEALRTFVLENPGRLEKLVRGPFESERLSDGTREGLRGTTMRMPPFMAQSTYLTPLTLSAWQHDLLMRWVDGLTKAAPTAEPGVAGPLSDGASLHRDAILSHLDAAGIVR